MEGADQDFQYETIYSEMASIGKDLNRQDVLECFSERVLLVFLSDQGVSPSASKMFARLQASVDARAKLQELERGMDKKHFVELVTGGYVMVSGRDKSTGLPILWHRSGLFNRNVWRYTCGSPRAKAFAR